MTASRPSRISHRAARPSRILPSRIFPSRIFPSRLSYVRRFLRAVTGFALAGFRVLRSKGTGAGSPSSRW